MDVIDLTADGPTPHRRRRSRTVIDLTAAPLADHSAGGPKAKRSREECAPCELCDASVPLSKLMAHQAACAERRAAGPSDGAAVGDNEGPADAPCPWCSRLFTVAALTQHGPRCNSLPARFKSGALPLELAAEHMSDGVVLTPAQAAALAHVAERAAPASAAAMPELLARASRLGYDAADVQVRASSAAPAACAAAAPAVQLCCAEAARPGRARSAAWTLCEAGRRWWCTSKRMLCCSAWLRTRTIATSLRPKPAAANSAPRRGAHAQRRCRAVDRN